MKLGLFNLSVKRLILRFYFFVALVLLTGFMHVDWFWVVVIAMTSFVIGFIGLSYQKVDRQNHHNQQWPTVFGSFFTDNELPQTPSFRFFSENGASA